MKTIIRMANCVLDGEDQIAREKLNAFGAKTLALSYAARKGEWDGAILLIVKDEGGAPVYMILGERPPELVVGSRTVWAVFTPPEAQEPAATFVSEEEAQAWALAQELPYEVAQIDATDRVSVKTSVAAIIRRGEDALLLRLKGQKKWAFPEAVMQVGETMESAARRAAQESCGIELGDIGIPAHCPYVNCYFGSAGQHFLVLLAASEYAGGEPRIPDQSPFEEARWWPLEHPPDDLALPAKKAIMAFRRPKERERERDPKPTPRRRRGTGAAKTSRAQSQRRRRR